MKCKYAECGIREFTFIGGKPPSPKRGKPTKPKRGGNVVDVFDKISGFGENRKVL